MLDKLRTLLLLFFTLGFIGCAEEELPSGIFDYQVERLLSGQQGSKTWSQVVNSTNCVDSIKLYFQSISDSLDVSQLDPSNGCISFDTTYLGRASASVNSATNLFTDSLIFSTGDHWIINTVTSQQLSLYREDQDVRNYNFAE